MTRHTVKPAARLAAIAEKYANSCQWLLDCPFDDGQPFFETAARQQSEWLKQMNEDARKTNDQALIESIETAIKEGEYGDFDDTGDGEVAFWRYIANWANGLVQNSIWER